MEVAFKADIYETNVGMSVSCEENMKELDMLNSGMYAIQYLSNRCCIINGNLFTLKDLKRSFNLEFCVTAYRYQGDTIDRPYCIYDV